MKTIVFDVGNVLLHWDARRVYADDFPDAAAIDAFLDEIDFGPWNQEQDRGRSWDDGVAEASARFPHHAPLIGKFHREWRKSVKGPIEGSVAILEQLHARGAPLYAITNFSEEKWAECLERFAFLGHFRDIVVSAHERLIKPDPALYHVLFQRNLLAPADCIFIDDSEANVAAAAALGMDAIHFTGAPALAEALTDRGALQAAD